jgi:hypothetical protein
LYANWLLNESYWNLGFQDWTCQGVWQQILDAVEEMRRQEGVVRLFRQFLNGEDLFGLNEPAIVRVLESLPGIESLTDYNLNRDAFLYWDCRWLSIQQDLLVLNPNCELISSGSTPIERYVNLFN